MPPKRMTANPVRPARYRPGKAVAEENSSSEEEDSDAEQEAAAQPQAHPTRAPAPKATTFPSAEAKKIANNLKSVDLNQRRKEGEAKERTRLALERAERERREREAGFVTESEEDDDEDDQAGEDEGEDNDDRIRSRPVSSTTRIPGPRRPAADASSSGSSEEESEEESSSEDEKPTLLRPVFIRKDKRLDPSTTTPTTTTPSAAAAPPDHPSARRQAQTDALLQEHLDRDAAARAAGKKAWDDDDADIEGAVDDTDGLDPELERQQWVARELGRIKRARAALEAREAEIAEVERRRGLTAQEREEEDREFISRQKEEKEGRGKAGFMARYHHRGAFAGAGAETGDAEGEARARELAARDLMGAQYEGREGMIEALPEYLQVRDAAMIGKKGRTRYKDLKSEDTGRWGEFGGSGRGRGGGFGGDERFRPDAGGRGGFGGAGGTGANAREVGERKRPYDDDREHAKRPRYDG